MSYNTKNYMAHGGAEFVIGGKLTILPGATVEDEGGVLGGGGTAAQVPVAENQAASTATTVAALKDDVNALLTKLKTAGLMAADAVQESVGGGGTSTPESNGNGEGTGGGGGT